MPTGACQLTIIAPVFNEAQSVSHAVALLTAAAASAVGDAYEVLFADDGSTDGTRDVLRGLSVVNPRIRTVGDGNHHGYGAMIRWSIRVAQGEYVLLTDGDGQFSCSELAHVWPQRAGVDMITGYRIDRREGWHRQFGTALLRAINRVLFNLRLRDVDCSFKLARASVFRSCDLRCNGFGIDTEIVLELLHRRAQLREIPVKHQPRVGDRSKLTSARLLGSMLEFVIVSVKKSFVLPWVRRPR